MASVSFFPLWRAVVAPLRVSRESDVEGCDACEHKCGTSESGWAATAEAAANGVGEGAEGMRRERRRNDTEIKNLYSSPLSALSRTLAYKSMPPCSSLNRSHDRLQFAFGEKGSVFTSQPLAPSGGSSRK